MSERKFPAGFLLGAATSAQQIEGAVHEGGRGESVWDRFATQPGAISDGSTPAVACDHYHRWREDVAWMRELGVGAYRFSVAWPRVMPAGTGPVNEAGLDFYDALVDELLRAGIQPFVTLNHWDLPQSLDERGGWGSRDTVEAFVQYAAAVAARLGDRVRHWITHNEPWCVAVLGHAEGRHAPGRRDPEEALRVAHHLLLSHGHAVPVLRQHAPGARVGIVLILVPVEPATHGLADRDAARRADGTFNRWYLDPLFLGRYPRDVVEDHQRRGHSRSTPMAFVRPGDLRVISTPTDFLGVNYYSRLVVRAGADREPEAVPPGPPETLTAMGWEEWPRGLTDILVRVTREYGPRRIFVTENGAAYDDVPAPDGTVADVRRVDYLRGHLEASLDAIQQGVPLQGYFAWSLMDNFEWGFGYSRRFGLLHVDYATGRRTPKQSAHFFREVASARAMPTRIPLLARRSP